jgi:ubiquitin C-terminal hydrolase
LLAKRVKRTAEDVEEGNEPVWSVASAQFLQPKSKTGFVGLSNQGATCYLNSLIQTLYMTPELRSALYAWTYDPQFDGPEERCIPLHLQRLFLRLQFGSAAIVDTKELTTSFGWSGGQAFQQHDVQELLRKLFEALDVCLTRGATAIRSKSNVSSNATERDPTLASSNPSNSSIATSNEPSPASHMGTVTANIVNELYEGAMLDYIRCMDCNYARERTDPFFDVPVAIREIETLEAGLEKYLAPEILSEGNQWHCDQCGTKVDAFKGLQFSRLPYFLTLQLNRFDYDHETWRRIKLNTKVTFPQQLDMNPFFASEPTKGNESASSRNQYELFSVMIHSGGAEGGHYYAFVKDFSTGKWFKFNDASVSEISDEDICSVFGGAPPRNQAIGAPSGEGGAPPPPPAAPAKNANHSSYSTNAYMLLYRLIDPSRNVSTSSEVWVPESQLAWIQSENAEFEKLRAEHQKRLDNVALTVFYEKTLEPLHASEEPATDALGNVKTANPAPSATDDMKTFTVNIDKHETLQTALQRVYEAGVARALALTAPTCIRLRPFTPQTGTKAPAWLEASSALTLEALNFHHQKNVYLEVKEAPGIAWIDEDVQYTLGIIKFNASTGNFDPAVSLRVPWRSTLSDLKQIIQNHPELSQHETDAQLHAIYKLKEGNEADAKDSPLLRVFAVDSSANCRELLEESGVLNETHRLNDGQCLHIEYMPKGGNFVSLVESKFDEERHKVQIFYNMFDTTNFDRSILIDTRRTLKALKDEIAKTLGENVSASDFKMCRNLLSKEFNNLDLTLAQANLYEGSAVCLVRGRPIGVNEIKLKISIFKGNLDDDEIFSQPWTITVDETITVDALRAQLINSQELHQHLVEIGKFPSIEAAASAEKFIRLREKKANRCASVLFDGEPLKTAMENLMDGDDVVIQILDFLDSLKRNQLILVFRRWVPLLRQLEPQSFEIIVPKTATMAETRRILAEFLISRPPPPHSDASTPEAYSQEIPLQFLGVSKPYLFMIKKKDAAALSGLNWELADDVQLTQSPWYLSDGALLLFKDMRDPEHGIVEASSAGSSTNGRPAPAREQGLKIHTIYDDHVETQEPSETPSQTTTDSSN